MTGTLYVCATPIGNLEDITLRALRVLKEADLIAAEDTRHTRILLERFGIRTPLTSYHKWNISSKTSAVIDLLLQGKNIALVSDAGTPGISDPGHELIREAVRKGAAVVPLPGASALTTALSVSGLPTEKFVFDGFLPSKKSERVKRLEKLKREEGTLIFYEAPHRLAASLRDAASVLGNRKVMVAREMTKKFEEFLRGNIDDIATRVGGKKLKGEFVVLVAGSAEEGSGRSLEGCLPLAKELLARGISKRDAVALLAKHFDLAKNELYDKIASTGK